MLIFTPQFDVFFIYYAHAYLFTLVLFVYLLLKRVPRKIGYQPIGLPSQNKEFTYLLTYLLTIEINLFNANSVAPDHTLRSVTSDLGLHCVQMSLLWVAMHKWVNAR